MGKKSPQRKTMGNLKKLEKVCASKTSLTETATKRPKKVELVAMSTIAGTAALQVTFERSVRKRARRMGTKALTTPKRIAPEVLASMRSFKGMGARRSRSNDFPFFFILR